MEEKKIAKLGELLKDFLGPNKTVTDHETRIFTELGDNYGSIILSLKIDIENEKQKEKLEAIAKIPHTNEFIRTMYNFPITFRHEINFYKLIVPELERFIKERNVVAKYLDCFPEHYGSRISLDINNKDKADDDAVLVLENLKLTNYECVDRKIGFDLETAKMILKALAKLHAVTIALKLSQPETFQNKIKPILAPFTVFPFDENMASAMIDKVVKVIEDIEDCKQYSSRAQEHLKSSFKSWAELKSNPKFVREPFATIIHTDAWVNNFMVQFSNGAPSKAKIVDFQLYEYGSPARDVVFFIFTSVQVPVVQKHYDDLIASYHASFLEVLKTLNCDTSQFSMEAFSEEIKRVSIESEFPHCMLMLEALFVTKDALQELQQMEAEYITRQNPVSQILKERAALIVKEFVKRNFI